MYYVIMLVGFIVETIKSDSGPHVFQP